MELIVYCRKRWIKGDRKRWVPPEEKYEVVKEGTLDHNWGVVVMNRNVYLRTEAFLNGRRVYRQVTSTFVDDIIQSWGPIVMGHGTNNEQEVSGFFMTNRRRRSRTPEGYLCEHANEYPAKCPCGPECECKKGMCRGS